MTPEQKLKQSVALKKKWASGTRKKNPPETYVKSSATHKRQFAEGLRKRPSLSSERAQELRKMVDADKLADINRIKALDKIGVPMPSGPGARGPGHWKAKYFILKTPEKKIIHGWNLAELIRNNASLFEPDDYEPLNNSAASEGRYCQCRAYKRLHSLFEINKSTGEPVALSWKGWTALARLEGEPTEIVNFPIWK